MSKWFAIDSNNESIALSTRVRLARNLKDFPFPNKLNSAKREQLINYIRQSFFGGNSYIAELYEYVNPKDLGPNQLLSLMEKNLVSPEFVTNPKGKGLILSKDGFSSILLCEEDHIRIQAIAPSLKEAFDIADKVDLVLGEELKMAYDERLGYLTQCPTNLGTAMRASIMLHLPALTETGVMGRISGNLSKLGITVRGTHGEGTKVQSCLYQISNQITLGLSETQAIENLSSIAEQVVGDELRARGELVRNPAFRDRIFRAVGILKYAHMMSSDEFLELISLVRLGLGESLLSGIEFIQLTQLSQKLMPASLTVDNKLEPHINRDVKRADIVREKFKNLMCICKYPEKD